MKIWILTTDDYNGNQSVVRFTAAEAEAAALDFCREHWPEDAGSMPENFAAAYELIQDGDRGLVWITEHDISAHPAIVAAIEATALAETVIGKLAKGDLNLHTEQGAIMDAYDAVADANCLLLGKMAADGEPDASVPATFTGNDGSTVSPLTRAALMQHPAFAGLNTDTEGNPCVWRNSYTCRSCTSEQIDWTDDWSCGCDDECPNCGESHSPHDQQWLAKCDANGFVGKLWENLPEAGSLEAEYVQGEAAMAEHNAERDRRETATILAALRYLQSYMRFNYYLMPPSVKVIATDSGEIEPLTSDEIDRLCEQINLNVESDLSF